MLQFWNSATCGVFMKLCECCEVTIQYFILDSFNGSNHNNLYYAIHHFFHLWESLLINYPDSKVSCNELATTNPYIST